jgi:hypothetical protein
VISILDAMADKNLFAPWFHRDPSSWDAWRAFLAVLFALPMTTGQLATFQRHTGRTTPPAEQVREAWLVCGRRSGKSFMLALCAVYLACFHDYRRFLQPGERGVIMIIARDRRQARTIFNYIRALLHEVPMLARMVERDTADTFDLTNGVSIQIQTASFRSVRGYTVVAGLMDEIAFWPSDDDSADPDEAVLGAIRPAMVTIPNAMLLCASSPYRRKGALWNAHDRHHGKEGDPILVWQAATRDMHPSIPQSEVDVALEKDPADASAEWLAQFRLDVESFISREAVAACVSPGIGERPPVSGVKYYGFVDPAGGSGPDSFTCAVGHKAPGGKIVMLDCVREVRPPFRPEAAVAEFAALLKSYRVYTVRGDRYAQDWPPAEFRKNGIRYDQKVKPKSDIYHDLLPVINSRRVELIENNRLVSQLCGLVRKTGSGGHDIIDHAKNGHDDVANAAAGVIVHLAAGSTYSAIGDWIDGPSEDKTESDRHAEWRRTHTSRIDLGIPMIVE